MYPYLNTSHMYCKCSKPVYQISVNESGNYSFAEYYCCEFTVPSFQATSLLSVRLYRTIIILESILTATSLKISQTRRRICPCKYSISTVLKLILKIATLTFGYPTGEMDTCSIPRRILALY